MAEQPLPNFDPLAIFGGVPRKPAAPLGVTFALGVCPSCNENLSGIACYEYEADSFAQKKHDDGAVSGGLAPDALLGEAKIKGVVITHDCRTPKPPVTRGS